MRKPDHLDEMKHIRVNYWSGAWVKNRFYGKYFFGSITKDYIPDELKENKWTPDENKQYKCWWYWTNPSDPADPGEDILVYIEEMNEKRMKTMKTSLVSGISKRIANMSVDQLKGLDDYIKKRYSI